MKNMHFYIQSIMVLLALCLAVQIPLNKSLKMYVFLLEFVLGVYQMGMSLLLRIRLTHKTTLLKIHFPGSIVYLCTLALLGLLDVAWMDDWWIFALFIVPWGIAIMFLVTIDELERARHYRL